MIELIGTKTAYLRLAECKANINISMELGGLHEDSIQFDWDAISFWWKTNRFYSGMWCIIFFCTHYVFSIPTYRHVEQTWVREEMGHWVNTEDLGMGKIIKEEMQSEFDQNTLYTLIKFLKLTYLHIILCTVYISLSDRQN